MNREDIIRMAREAHRRLVTEDYPGHTGQLDPWTMALLERFALLVRDQMLSEGWRQCAQSQRTTQHCAVAEQARQQRESINGPIVHSSGEQLARRKT